MTFEAAGRTLVFMLALSFLVAKSTTAARLPMTSSPSPPSMEDDNSTLTHEVALGHVEKYDVVSPPAPGELLRMDARILHRAPEEAPAPEKAHNGRRHNRGGNDDDNAPEEAPGPDTENAHHHRRNRHGHGKHEKRHGGGRHGEGHHNNRHNRGNDDDDNAPEEAPGPDPEKAHHHRRNSHGHGHKHKHDGKSHGHHHNHDHDSDQSPKMAPAGPDADHNQNSIL